MKNSLLVLGSASLLSYWDFFPVRPWETFGAHGESYACPKLGHQSENEYWVGYAQLARTPSGIRGARPSTVAAPEKSVEIHG
jgi:hypothetical protein